MASCNILILFCLLGLLSCSEQAIGQKRGKEQYHAVTESYEQMEIETLHSIIGQFRRETVQLRQVTNEFPVMVYQMQENINALEQKIAIHSQESQICKENFVDLLESHRKLQHNFDILNQKFTEQRKGLETGISVGHKGNQNVLSEQIKQTTRSNSINVSGNMRNHRLPDIEKTPRLTKENTESQILQNNSRVALTACVYTDDIGPQPAGHVIKFSDIRTRVGIDSVSSFKTNGKFTCEVEGLYLVSLTFISTVRFGEVGLYKNGTLLTRTFTTTDDGGQAYSSTVMAAVELQSKDSVWVQINYRTTTVYTYNWHELCMTIAKIA